MIAAGVALLLAVVIALDAVPFLRGGELFRWQWPYEPGRALPLLAVTGVYVAGAWWLLRRAARRRWLLGWALAGAVLIPLAALAARSDNIPYELFLRTVSGITTGPHTAGAEIDWGAARTWRDWPAVMLDFDRRSGHIALSPPGAPLVYAALNAALDHTPFITQPLYRAFLPWACHDYRLLAYSPAQWASAIFGMLMPLWAALAVFPLYAVGRRLAGDDSARQVALWWALVPGLVMFVPTWNTLYPLLALAAFWLLLRGLDAARGAPGWWLAAGVVSGLLTFFNVALLPLPLLLGFYTLLRYALRERSHRPLSRLLAVGLWFALGLALPWLMYYAIGGVTPFAILEVALGRHLGQERPYLPWVWFHLWEWALFSGVGLVLLALWVARRGGGDLRALALALLLTLLALALSGTARGETGRVWSFFTPFLLLAALPGADTPRRAGWLAVTVTQAALMAALAASIPVMTVLDMTPPPPPPGAASAGRPADAWFGDDLHLVGWDAAAEGGHIRLSLNWRARDQVTTPYWFAALLVDPNGAAAGEPLVWQPGDTRYPATCWQPGEITGDTVLIPLPDDAPPGGWWLSLVAFADVAAPETRLTVQQPGQPPDDQLGLGPVVVEQAASPPDLR
jgi:hypothetical protein